MSIELPPPVLRPLRYVAGVLVGCAVPSAILGKSLGFVIAAAVISLVATAVLRGPGRLKRLLPTRAFLRAPLFWTVAAMLATWLVSALWTLDPPRSPLIWLQCAGVIVLGWLLIRLLAEDAVAYDAALRALVVATLVAGVFGCLVCFVEPSLLSLVRNRTADHAFQVRDILKSFGSVLPPAAFVAIYAGRRLGGAWRWAGYATLPIALLFAAGIHSGAGLVGFAGALIALCVFGVAARLPRRAARWAILAPLLIGLAASGWIVARLPTPPVTEARQIALPTWLIDRHRQAIWGFALHKAVRGPLFGYGLNTAGRVPGAKEQIALFKGQYVPSHTHNWIVQLALETGLPGTLTALAALGCLIALLYVRARRWHAGTRDEAAWTALAVTAAVFVSWLFNFSLFAGWWQMVFVILLAIPMAALRPDSSPTKPSEQAAPEHDLTGTHEAPRTKS